MNTYNTHVRALTSAVSSSSYGIACSPWDYSDFHGHTVPSVECLFLVSVGKPRRIRASRCGRCGCSRASRCSCRAISHEYWVRSRRLSPNHARGVVASAVFMLLARSPSSRGCSWGVGSYAWTFLLVSMSGMAFPCRDGRLVPVK